MIGLVQVAMKHGADPLMLETPRSDLVELCQGYLERIALEKATRKRARPRKPGSEWRGNQSR